MTKRYSTKRSLVASILILCLCFTSFVGTTFAWFTDEVTSANNIIKTGNLDVVLEYKNDWNEDWKKVEGNSPVFDEKALFEPGYTEVVYLRVSNAGSLALKYQLSIDVVSEIGSTNVNGDEFKLSDFIKIGSYVQDEYSSGFNYANILMPTMFGSRDSALQSVKEMKPFESVNEPIVSNAPILPGNDTAKVIAIVINMPETVGNDANYAAGYNAPEINFGVTLLATQYVHEDDSFGNDYDADAVFGTYVELEAGADLLAAMAAAEADLPLTIKLNGDVEWLTDGHHGENDVTPASKIVIDGNGHTITATGSGVTPLGDTEAPMTIKNAKIVDKSVSYNESAWELSYLELGGRELNCVNVEFVDPIQVVADNASFSGCSFVGHYDSVSTSTTQYAVWGYNGNSTYTDCTFTGTRGIKLCDDYAGEVGTVVIDRCTFNGISEKPGVVIDDHDTQDMKITIKNSTFINCKAGDQGLYVYETDNTMPTVENNIVESYTELVEIASKEQLAAFAKRVNSGDGMSGVLVKLTNDIDLAGMEWTPIGQTGDSYGATNYFQGIFDGQGHTISNMTITQTNAGKHYAAGFFGFIDAADVTIRNVIFDKASVKGHHWTGVVAGYLTGNIDNCKVTNSNVLCTHANNDACGDKAGAIVGYINNGLVNNCSASNTTIAAGRDAGQIVGASKTAYVANCSASNVTVSANGDCTGSNIREDIIGRVTD